MMKVKTINQDEVAILLAVLEETTKLGYDTMQRDFGNIGTDRVLAVQSKLTDWYYKNVLHYRKDPEYGWIDPADEY